MTSPLRVGFVEPHLELYGGIRRILELANRLVGLGHDVTIYLPSSQPTRCTWMPCEARIQHVPEGFTDELDVVIFNHEPQWHLLELFTNARRRAFFALHYAEDYAKEGSWEAVRYPVDLRLANSGWTADRVAAAAGVERPAVLPGGIDRATFHPVDVPKQYPILCVGDDRSWKGTHVIQAAADELGLPLEKYAPKHLRQDQLAGEYSRAHVFVVGSETEGFGQPGLEALACGVPLVTTDTGGSREYAFNGETALVVPPRDPNAMAEAIQRVLSDAHLRRRLVANGLALVAEKFDWDRAAARLEALLEQTLERPPVTERRLRDNPDDPELSIVVLAWDQLLYTQWCVNSLRVHTKVPYELIIVDNGSRWEARNYAAHAADVAVLNDENRGFAAGMNQGLHAARGDVIAFVNNDTEFPTDWERPLLESIRQPRTGIVVPAVTEARNRRTVRDAPGTQVEVLDPFEPPPAAVVYVMRRQEMDALGGWGEEFLVASGEDVDLAFKIWVNDLDIRYDQRVVVDHVGKGTASKLDDWQSLWAANQRRFLEKWTANEIELPRLDSCPEDRWQRNLRTARAVAGWMTRSLGRPPSRRARLKQRTKQAVRGALDSSDVLERTARRTWHRISPHVPVRWRRWVRSSLSRGTHRPTKMND